MTHPGACTQMEHGSPARAKEVPLSWGDRACRGSRPSRLKEHLPTKAAAAAAC